MELAKNAPIARREADVLVVGAGISGCTAAVRAAREGASTMLVERGGLLGGLATNGLQSRYRSQLLDAGGRPKYLGMSRELLKRVLNGTASDITTNVPTDIANGISIDIDDAPSCGLVFDEQLLKLVLAEMLKDAGVTVLSHTFASDVTVEKGTVTGMYVEGKAGRIYVAAGAIVDATELAAVAFRAGCKMIDRSPEASLGFKIGGVDVGTFAAGLEAEQPAARRAEFRTGDWTNYGVICATIGLDKFKTGQEMWLQVHGLRGRNEVIVHRTPAVFESIDPVLIAREQMRQQLESYDLLAAIKQCVAGFERATVVHNATKMSLGTPRTIVSREHSWWRQSKERGAASTAISTINARPARCAAEQLTDAVAVPFGAVQPETLSGLYVVNPKALDEEAHGLLASHAVAADLGVAAGIAAAAEALGKCGEAERETYVADRLCDLREAEPSN